MSFRRYAVCLKWTHTAKHTLRALMERQWDTKASDCSGHLEGCFYWKYLMQRVISKGKAPLSRDIKCTGSVISHSCCNSFKHAAFMMKVTFKYHLTFRP